MRVLLVLASVVMLVSAESPTGYSHRSSNPDLNFQPVPSVAQIHIPPSQQQHQPQYSMPHVFSTIEKQYPGPQFSYSLPQQISRSGEHMYAASHQHFHYTPPQQRQDQVASNQQQQYSAPPQQYTSHSQHSQQYSTPTQSQQYSAPSQSPQYSAPSQSQPQYSAPQQYAPQPQQYSVPANVQVNYGAPPQLPPGATFGPTPIVTGAGPDHNIEYRVVYVKGPKAPKPDLILPPPPPQQKTLVYILVPKVEPPEPIIVPTHAPTPPSKPEVYFIRYKAQKKNKQSTPSSSYGSPIGSASGEFSSPVVVQPPRQAKSETTTQSVSVSSSSSAVASSPKEYGDKVKSGQS